MARSAATISASRCGRAFGKSLRMMFTAARPACKMAASTGRARSRWARATSTQRLPSIIIPRKYEYRPQARGQAHPARAGLVDRRPGAARARKAGRSSSRPLWNSASPVRPIRGRPAPRCRSSRWIPPSGRPLVGRCRPGRGHRGRARWPAGRTVRLRPVRQRAFGDQAATGARARRPGLRSPRGACPPGRRPSGRSSGPGPPTWPRAVPARPG